MSNNITIRDTATELLKEIQDRVKPGQINPRIGQAVSNAIKDHLFETNSIKSNALGGKRTNFYAQAAKLTNWMLLLDGVKIDVGGPIGFRQRLKGGTIRPRTAKMLTIPAVPEAHGKRASEFNNLQMLFNSLGKPFALATPFSVVKGVGTYGRTKKKKLSANTVIFWLAGKVEQKGDPSILPDDKTLMDEALLAVKDYVALIKARKGAK